MRLKSWESPRCEGRNSKGKGGSARARQLKKRQQTLRKVLKAGHDRQNHQPNNQGKETNNSFPYFLSVCSSIALNIPTNPASNALSSIVPPGQSFSVILIRRIFFRYVVEGGQLRSRRLRRKIVFGSRCGLFCFRAITLPPAESDRHPSSTQSKSQ